MSKTSPTYNETTVAGQSWQRCNQIVIENPRSGPPVVRFEEERVLTLPSGEFRTPMPGLSLPFDPTKTFELLDPDTGLPLGKTVSFGEAYVLLYSAYIAAATERDTPAPTANEITEEAV